jgi:hypothetical protein
MTIDAATLVPIERMREHLRLESDDDSQDGTILLYANAALGWCLWFCDEPRWLTSADVPSQVESAMLLVLTDLFEHRSSQSEFQLYKNPMAEALLFSCRNWSGAAPAVVE